MAKKKNSILPPGLREQDLLDRARVFGVEAAAPRVEIATVKVPVKEVIEVVVYSFPTRSRCPRCGTIGTKAYCTKGRKQHRKCMTPVCRERFVVVGIKV
jgi:hypothetical protein